MSEAKPFTALEIAVLVKMLPNEDGARLIENYAACEAAGAALDAATEAHSRIARAFSGKTMEPANG